MKMKTNGMSDLGVLLNRRRTLALLGGAGVLAVTGRLSEVDADAATCVNLAGAQTEGPYWVEENLNRSDIRTDPSDGSVRPGAPLAGAHVDVWHCDAAGTYSDEAA